MSAFVCDFSLKKGWWILLDSKGTSAQTKVNNFYSKLLTFCFMIGSRSPNGSREPANAPILEALSTDCPVADNDLWLTCNDTPSSTVCIINYE